MKRLSNVKSDEEILLDLIYEKEDYVDDFFKQTYKEFYGCGYDVDIYAYLNEDKTDFELSTFSNPGGNSWLNDDHIYIYTFKMGNCDWPIDNFNSYNDFIDYMIKYYNIVIPEDILAKVKDEDDYFDEHDLVDYICKNYDETYTAFCDEVDETWDFNIYIKKQL